MSEKTPDLLAGLLNDPTVMEIMVDRYDRIYVERKGKLEDVESPFRDEDHLQLYIQRLAESGGRKIDPTQPMVSILFPDNQARASAVFPPIALDGAKLVIRKFPTAAITLEDLLNRYDSLNRPMADFLKACVEAKVNLLVAGGTGSGKTTVLNVIAEMIPSQERIILTSQGAELKLEKPRLVSLQTFRPNNAEPVTMQDLLLHAATMRPDRIVVSELRGEETLTFLNLLNSGYDGSMSALHATGVRDALGRLELLTAGAAPTLPLLNIRELIAGSLDLIIHQQKLRDGTRRIMSISEVVGMTGDNIQTENIFIFQENGQGEDGQMPGEYKWSGYLPQFAKNNGRGNLALPKNFFGS